MNLTIVLSFMFGLILLLIFLIIALLYPSFKEKWNQCGGLKDFCKKFVSRKNLLIYMLVVTVIAISIFTVFLINESYKVNQGYTTLWGADDLLSFYCSILSLIGTLILGAVTYIQTKNANRINKELAVRQLETLNHESQIKKLNDLNNALQTIFKHTDIDIFEKIILTQTHEDFILLREQLFEAKKGAEYSLSLLDFFPASLIDPSYQFITSDSLQEIYEFKQYYSKYMCSYFQLLNFTIISINKVLQYIDAKIEDQQYDLMLKEMARENDKYEQKYLFYDLLYRSTQNPHYLAMIEKLEGEIAETIKKNAEEKDLINQLKSHIRSIKYTANDLRNNIQTNTVYKHICGKAYQLFKQKNLRCQHIIQDELNRI